MQRSTSLFSFQHQSLYEGVESAGRGEAVARSEGIEEIGELIGFPTEFGGRQTDRADGRTREEHHFLLNWPDKSNEVMNTKNTLSKLSKKKKQT